MSIPRIDKPILIQQNPQGQSLYQAPNGQVGTQEQAQSIFSQQVAEKSKQRNQDVQKHEDLHELVAGPFATGKTIDFGSDQAGNPIATGGHVNVQMPPIVSFKAPMAQIQQAEEHARAVAASAIAPSTLGGDAGTLSSADKSVFAQASIGLGTATAAKSQRLVFEGQIASREGKTPDKNQELNAEMINGARNPQQTPQGKPQQERKPLNIFA